MQDNPNNPVLEPAILVIFGITGDLAKRYLMPSLYHLFKQGLLHEKTEIVGISRRNIDLDDLFNNVEMCVSEDDNICDPVVMAHMQSHSRVQQMDMDDPDAYKQLLQVLNDIETENGVCMNRLYYLSIPPVAYTEVVKNMGAGGLNASCQHGQAMSRLLVEKPFGQDLESAEKLITDTGNVFGEEQVFRIDHYLAKETAQNIIAFRFENPLFEAIWDNQHITAIDILASEKIGIEGRAGFYEQQGALRDLIQNHLLQLLAVVTMEKPARMDSDAIHKVRLELLKAVEPITADLVLTQSGRAQYQNYRQDVGNENSYVETYAGIQTSINTPRWQGVPVTIRTGKALVEKQTTITVTFADGMAAGTNNLHFRIQPNEGIQLDLTAKKPGFDQELQPVVMDFSYTQNFHELQHAQPTAYERVLVDAVRGDRTLFTSSQEVLAAWRVVDEVVKAWRKGDDGLHIYQPGTPIDDLWTT